MGVGSKVRRGVVWGWVDCGQVITFAGGIGLSVEMILVNE